MLAQRSTHYWLWFLLFGVVATAVRLTQHAGLDSESIWLLVTGALGVLTGSRLLSSLSRPYDLIVGLLFTGVGLIGILHNFGINLVATNPAVPNGAVQDSAILGLSLSLTFSLIHTVLGLTSLNHGLKLKPAAPSVVVGAGTTAAA